MREYLEDVDWKKAAIFAPIFLLVLALGIYFFVLPEKTEEEKAAPQETIEVTDADYEGINQVVHRFMDNVGSFGFNMQAVVNANALNDTIKLLRENPNAVDSSFYRSRAQAYMDSRSTVLTDSPAYYASSLVAKWPDTVELAPEQYRLFKSTNVQVERPETMTTIEHKGAQIPVATVDVYSDNTVSFAENKVHGTSWDGTYFMKKKDFKKHKTQLRVVKSGGQWYIYSVKQPQDEFLLAAWKAPDDSEYLTELTQGYEDAGVIKIDLASLGAPTSEAPVPAAGDTSNGGQ